VGGRNLRYKEGKQWSFSAEGDAGTRGRGEVKAGGRGQWVKPAFGESPAAPRTNAGAPGKWERGNWLGGTKGGLKVRGVGLHESPKRENTDLYWTKKERMGGTGAVEKNMI